MSKAIDIRQFVVPEDSNLRIAVDTNVLIWWFYGRVSYVSNANDKLRKKAYQDFAKVLARNKRNIFLCTSAVNISEVYHVIEKTELDIYNDGMPTFQMKLKDFRSAPQSRSMISQEIKAFYSSTSRFLEICDYDFTKEFINDYRKNYKTCNCDSLDASLMDFCEKNKIDYVLTDDVDFMTFDSQINILTANERALAK